MDISVAITYTLLFITLFGEIFLLLAFIDSYGETEGTHDISTPKRIPTVAIIVPCFNEEKTVGKTIESLLGLTYPVHALQIIVVDDGSTDATYAVASTYTDPRVTVLKKENGGKHSAMNLALKYTTAEIIGCLDADSYVEPHALVASINQLEDTGAVAVTPAITIMKPSNLLQLIQQAEYSLSVFIRRAFSAAGAIFITPGPFSLFKRDVIVSLGGWRHAHGTEDLEMGLRLQNHSYKITNTPKARAITKSPDTLYKLYKQRVRWTYGFIMNAIDYKHMFFNPRFGALGIVLLPVAFLSIFTALYFSITLTLNTLIEVYNAFVRISITGIHAPSMLVDPFYIASSVTVLMVYLLIAVAVCLILIGKRLSGSSIVSLDIPLYIALYGFIAPLWLLGATVRAALKKQAAWR